MRKIFYILLLIQVSNGLYGQNNKFQFNFDSLNYAMTAARRVDTLDYWNYKLNLSYKSDYPDSINPIGILTFYRIKSVDDNNNNDLLSKPSISFEIYNRADSSYCQRKAMYTRVISSCSSPNVGGDCFNFGNFVFLNRQVCLNCFQYSTNIDYCRATINYIFKNIRSQNVTDIKDLVKQFTIKLGQ